jgi:hypothetical protein
MLLLILAFPALAEESEPFAWSVSPYLWMPQTQLDLSLRDEALGGGTVSFKELLDKTDASLMFVVEGGRDDWSLLLDVAYLEISDSEQRPVFRIDTKATSVMLDAAVAYWPPVGGTPLSLIAGMRYHEFDNRYRFRLGDTLVTEAKTKDGYYDALLGVRYQFDLSPRWDLTTRADTSFGESEGSFMLRATLGVTVGKAKRNRILLGYQYRTAEFSSGDLKSEFTYHGPTAGFNFRF